MEYKYKFIKQWLESHKNTAFTKEDIELLNELVKRQAE